MFQLFHAEQEKAPRKLFQRDEVVLYWNVTGLMECVKWIYVCVLVFVCSDLIRSVVLGVKLALPKQVQLELS